MFIHSVSWIVEQHQELYRLAPAKSCKIYGNWQVKSKVARQLQKRHHCLMATGMSKRQCMSDLDVAQALLLKICHFMFVMFSYSGQGIWKYLSRISNEEATGAATEPRKGKKLPWCDGRLRCSYDDVTFNSFPADVGTHIIGPSHMSLYSSKPMWVMVKVIQILAYRVLV